MSLFQETWPPEELDSQVPDLQSRLVHQLFTSLVRRCSGWFDKQALHRTRYDATICNSRVPWAGALSLGRKA
jgi:hypothetical protein